MRHLFVVGSPRSGTTMVGALLATHPRVYSPGEYFAFYATEFFVKRPLARIPSLARDRWFGALDRVASELAETLCAERGSDIFCDATPWNMLIADSLQRRFPDAVFVVCIRHPSGVIESLERSFSAGYHWAGHDDRERARLYASIYAAVDQLPEGRTITFDYDEMCAQPESTLERFLGDVQRRIGLDSASIDVRVLAKSHAAAPVAGGGAPIATIDERGISTFLPRQSHSAQRWAEQRTPEIDEILGPAVAAIAFRFPESRLVRALTAPLVGLSDDE